MQSNIRNSRELWRRGQPTTKRPDVKRVARPAAQRPAPPAAPKLEASVAACRLQRATRALLARRSQQQLANVAHLLASKRREVRQVARPPVTRKGLLPPPQHASSGTSTLGMQDWGGGGGICGWDEVLGGSSLASRSEEEIQLEERLQELQRVVASERWRLEEAQRKTDDVVDHVLSGPSVAKRMAHGGTSCDLGAAQEPTSVSLPALPELPWLEDDGDAAHVLHDRHRGEPVGRSGQQAPISMAAVGYATSAQMPRSSLDEFRSLEHECSRQLTSPVRSDSAGALTDPESPFREAPPLQERYQETHSPQSSAAEERLVSPSTSLAQCPTVILYPNASVADIDSDAGGMVRTVLSCRIDRPLRAADTSSTEEESFQNFSIHGDHKFTTIKGAELGYKCGVLATGKSLVFNGEDRRELITRELNTTDAK